MKKSILVTGGAGFIGGHLICTLLEKYKDYHILNIDKLTYAGNLNHLESITNFPNYTFVQGDVTDNELVRSLFNTYKFFWVIHLAAESHVGSSIHDPASFVKTNLEGTFVLLDAAYKHWFTGPGQVKEDYQLSRFLHVSTDEVYGMLGNKELFTEATPYAPNNPYSATKAGSDLLVRSYVHTYGLDAVITHATNNYGTYQHKEKLIPTIITKALAGEAIPIDGNGSAIRDWLYVGDHCNALDLVLHNGTKGEHYNIGANNELSNLHVATTICKLLDKLAPLSQQRSYQSLITFVADRPGQDKRYAVDASKVKRELGWVSATPFEVGLQATVEWYLKEIIG